MHTYKYHLVMDAKRVTFNYQSSSSLGLFHNYTDIFNDQYLF